eukprot:IDg1406t1
MASDNKCTVLFDQRGGAVVDGEIDLTQLPVRARIQRQKNLYYVKARRARAQAVATRAGATALGNPAKNDTTANGAAGCARNLQRKKGLHQWEARFPAVQMENQGLSRTQMEAAHNWHIRLNHVIPDTIRIMANMPQVIGLEPCLRVGRPPMTCSGCAAGHTQRAPHVGSTPKVPAGHTVVADLAGPFHPTPDSHRYLLVLTEQWSRFRLAFLLRRKSDAEHAIMTTVTAVARHFGQPHVKLRVDNANELLSRAILRFLDRRGIAGKPTTPHTPHENSIAERT